MALLSATDRIEVVGYAADGREAAELAESLSPDLVLMDLSMPAMDGIEATRRIKERSPETAVLMLTGSDAQADVSRAADAGAAGYLTKDSASSNLIATILEITALASAARPASP